MTVDKPIADEFIRGMGAGVPILGTVTKNVRSEKESAVCLSHYPVQGLNRQIRRMCEYFGYEVTKLEHCAHYERQPERDSAGRVARSDGR